jgi:beta-lactamase superfamily II metal-dependent hydrolase
MPNDFDRCIICYSSDIQFRYVPNGGPVAIDYVSVDTSPLLDSAGDKLGAWLLWGDRVDVIQNSGNLSEIKTGRLPGKCFVKSDDLGGASLLEFYFIDVGQGDGVLIRTPDDRHILIDGGFPRKNQPAGKNAADFVDWKFVKDYRKQDIRLDAVITSHNDADHYGGLWDLLNEQPAARAELDARSVSVEAFYHSGISWWKSGNTRTLGTHISTENGPMWTKLLGNRSDVKAALDGGNSPQLAGEWGKFLASVLGTKKSNGQPTPITRLSHVNGYLPGFEPSTGKPSVKVLAPVEFQANGGPALRRFAGGDSKNTNGQSSLLRIDFGRARILLTGDLNSAAQKALLEDYAGSLQEFECDVAKACHHGSDDVSYRFLQTLRPAVTVISSGDSEGHDHPRPGIVAASATTGFLEFDGDAIVSPLIYSTELARSYSLGLASGLMVQGPSGADFEIKGAQLASAELSFKGTAGVSASRTYTLGNSRIVTNLIYGLVNVRTDGQRILCATRSEMDGTWQIKVVNSRF